MRTDEYAKRKKAEMLEVARLMLAGRCDLIEGCRRIVSLGSLLDAENDPAIIPFRGVASETERFPRGDVRKNFAADFLDELDSEADEYLEEARTEILRSCGDLLSRFDE
jgi:hypothetical protein